MDGRRASQTRARVRIVEGGNVRVKRDLLATEEPLELRLRAAEVTQTVAVTMRTPGADFELAAGFLFAEGVINSRDDLTRIEYCVDPEVNQQYNVVTVELREGRTYEFGGLDRHFYTTSACGVCGKASLDQLELRGAVALPPGPIVPATVISGLPDRLREAQGIFETTGGLHAAGLFNTDGDLLALREDVGRHNAVDKVIGWALLEERLPLREHIIMVSGRGSYEIAQKCLAAGVAILCAVSAPSSLAVDVAKRFGMTLIGFLREDRFNVYHGFERLRLKPAGDGEDEDGII